MENYSTYSIASNYSTQFFNDQGELHRLDGPAYMSSGDPVYFINGICYTYEQYWQHPDVLKYKMLEEAKSMLGLSK